MTTEAEWLTCTNPYLMLNPLEGTVSDRKCYLFSVACLRRVQHLITDERCRKLVEVYERFVDSLASDDERVHAEEGFGAPYEAHDLQDVSGGNILEALRNLACYRGAAAAFSVAGAAAEAVAYVTAMPIPDDEQGANSFATRQAAWRAAEAAESLEQAGLVKEILGPLPFRPILLDAAWLTPTVLTLAHTIYNSPAFHRMRELADALAEAGCTNAAILAHCRQSGPHVRGCWALDLLLGKE